MSQINNSKADMSWVVHRRQSVLKTEAYYKCMDEIAHSLRETFYFIER